MSTRVRRAGFFGRRLRTPPIGYQHGRRSRYTRNFPMVSWVYYALTAHTTPRLFILGLIGVGPTALLLLVGFDNRIPAASDDIALTLNYKDVSKRLIEYVGASGFGLVETLAERCAAIILTEFNVSHVRLKLSKPGAVRGARAVGVIIEREKGSE